MQGTVEVFLNFPGLKDDQDNEGRTAFMWAAGQGADAVLQVFINHKVDMLQTEKMGGSGKSDQDISKTRQLLYCL